MITCFRILNSIVLCLLAINAHGKSWDNEAVDSLQEYCKSLPDPTISRSDVQFAMQEKLFPMPMDEISEFAERAEKFSLKASQAIKCGRHEPVVAPYVPPRAKEVTDLFSKLGAIMKAQLQTEFTDQSLMIQQGKICSDAAAKFYQKFPSKRMDRPTQEDFEAMASSTDTKNECLDFYTYFLPELKRRFEVMREYLFLSTDPTPKRMKSISHHTTISETVLDSFFPNANIGAGGRAVSPIPLDRVERANRRATQISKEQARQRYFEYLSATPILMHFSDTPNPFSTAQAFDRLNQQILSDKKLLENNLPQEISLVLPAVANAIRSLPREDKANACLLINEMQINIFKKTELIPGYTALAGIGLSGGMGLFAQGPGAISKVKTVYSTAKAALGSTAAKIKAAVPGLSVTGGVVSTMHASNKYNSYVLSQDGCRRTLIAQIPEANQTSRSRAQDLVSSFCDLEESANLKQEAQEYILSSGVMFGVSAFGFSRLLGNKN